MRKRLPVGSASLSGISAQPGTLTYRAKVTTEDELRLNEHGQPIGPDLGDWVSPSAPTWESLIGRTVRLDPLDPAEHGSALAAVFNNSPDDLWTYLPWGPYSNKPNATTEVAALVEALNKLADWQSYAVVVDGAPLGMMSYLRIDPTGGAIEIGGIYMSSALQQTTAATEALYLLIKRSFDLGYRRCEWKCDDLNAPSRAAAARLGFIYEGTFRKVTHYKGRSRDTAWFAIVDDDWPALDARFSAWLSPDNFDSDGQQLTRLGDR